MCLATCENKTRFFAMRLHSDSIKQEVGRAGRGGGGGSLSCSKPPPALSSSAPYMRSMLGSDYTVDIMSTLTRFL